VHDGPRTAGEVIGAGTSDSDFFSRRFEMPRLRFVWWLTDNL
jgi:hypothetical protein